MGDTPGTVGDRRGDSAASSSHAHQLSSGDSLKKPAAQSLGCFFGVGGAEGRNGDRLEEPQTEGFQVPPADLWLQ